MSLFGYGTIELHTPFEQVENRPHKSLRLAICRLGLKDNASPYHQIGHSADELHNLHATSSLHQSGMGAIRHLQQTSYRHLHADRQKIFGTRVVEVGVMLSQTNHGLLFILRFLYSQQGAFPPDKDRGDHAWEHHQISQREDCDFDHAIFVRLPVRDAIQLLCALGEGQIKIIFFFVPVFYGCHLLLVQAGALKPHKPSPVLLCPTR